MLDARLISAINRGRCFAFIGAGPSCEMGYPSWHQLAEKVYQAVKNQGIAVDERSYKKYLDQCKYPELLELAQGDLKSRPALISAVRANLVPEAGRTDTIYQTLARWPFCVYITTNFDDEISKHLTKERRFFQVVRSKPEELARLRDGVSDLIVKIHSDLDHPDEVVLTSSDYQRIKVDGDAQSYRHRLRALFQTFDILIVGHSLTDPDIQIVLEEAKGSSLPDRPVFMIAANVTAAESREYAQKYNILVSSYDDHDGHHAQLRRILSATGKYIIPHTDPGVRAPLPQDAEVEAAEVLLLYRNLQHATQHGVASPAEYIGPVILHILFEAASTMPESKLLEHKLLKTIASTDQGKQAAKDALSALSKEGLIGTMADGTYAISPSGRDQFRQVSTIRADQELKAFGQFGINLRASCTTITDAQEQQAKEALKSALVGVFKSHGRTMARAIFEDRSLPPSELSSVFAAVTRASSTFNDAEQRIAFISAAHEFILEPSKAQKEYLSSVSQGFFLYHLAGLDPMCTKVRRDLLKSTCWFCDSGILIRILAYGCLEHAYNLDLLNRLETEGGRAFATSRLVRETFRHLQGAITNTRLRKPLALLGALLKRPGESENLFLEGFVRLSDGGGDNFHDYLNRILEGQEPSEGAVRNQLQRLGVTIVDLTELSGYKLEDQVEVEENLRRITAERASRSTFRGDWQVQAEAEVLQMVEGFNDGSYTIKGETGGRACFVSSSPVLDSVTDGKQALLNWNPEALYRYMAALPGENVDPELLQQCMLQEYYLAGIRIVDRPRYEKFFGPLIRESRVAYEEEKKKYLVAAGTGFKSEAELDRAFNATPDLEKPFFVNQMAWRILESAHYREDELNRKLIATENENRKLRADQEAGYKIKRDAVLEEELRRLKNSLDPKHLRKRKRQAKRRKKKR